MEYSNSTIEQKNQNSKIANLAKGMIFIIIGLAVLLRKIPETNSLIPDLLYGPHTLLILIGIYQGIKSQFSNVSWLILVIIGMFMTFNRLDWFDGHELLTYGIPIGIIILGLFVIIKK